LFKPNYVFCVEKSEGKAEAAKNKGMIVAFVVEGSTYKLDIEGRKVTTGSADGAKLTVTIKGADLIALASGKLNPMQAFMSGKMKIKGDMMKAQKLTPFFNKLK
jgi:putative sterol carrier protein